MSLLNQKVLPALNGKYEANVKSFKEVENDNGGYVEVIFTLPDREYTYIMFPSQVNYVVSALRRQFEMQDKETTLEKMLEKAKTTKINIWISYNPTVGRNNVAFHEPIVVDTTEDIEL